MTKDSGMVACGGKEGVVRILKLVDGQYVLHQSIAPGFRVMEVLITDNHLAMSGASDTILFFRNNATEFIPDQTLLTDETNINEFGITEDFEKIALGKFNQTVNIFAKGNGTYRK